MMIQPVQTQWMREALLLRNPIPVFYLRFYCLQGCALVWSGVKNKIRTGRYDAFANNILNSNFVTFAFFPLVSLCGLASGRFMTRPSSMMQLFRNPAAIHSLQR